MRKNVIYLSIQGMPRQLSPSYIIILKLKFAIPSFVIQSGFQERMKIVKRGKPVYKSLLLNDGDLNLNFNALSECFGCNRLNKKSHSLPKV